MSESFRKESRKEWSIPGGDTAPSTEDLQLGCLQRIADATELMAKRYQELIEQKDRAERSRDHWMGEHDRMARRLIAMRGQITKLKKALATGSAA